MLKHKHHIIPKHAGGTDNASNIIELTIEEHANAHKILFEKYGRKEDRWAWLGLSGQIGKDEILKEIAKSQKGKKKPEGFGKKISAFRRTFKYSEESKRKMSESKKGKIITEEHKNKISKSLMGHKSSKYQKQRTIETRQKKYLITNPSGISFGIINLSRFCRENNLDQGNMHKNLVKGWKCIKIDS
jgi:hypothetical protein